jgi:HAD superfamily hydrolase (TIGR01490 family)
MHAKSQTNQNLALFDFDGTLYKKDSFTGFIFYALSKRHIIRRGIPIYAWIQAYYLKLYPAHAMRPKLFHAMFKKCNVNEIDHIARDYAQYLIQDFNPELLKQLRLHQAHGDQVVLVSATIDIYLKYVAEYLNIAFICSHVEIQNGQYTGRYTNSDCSNQEKANQVLKQYKLSHYKHIYAYGNSDEDLAMLNLAHHSFYVGKTTQLPNINSSLL